MKNYVYIKGEPTGDAPYILLDADSNSFPPFASTVKQMVRKGNSPQTIEDYSGHLARFLDYLFEAANLIEHHSAEHINDAIYSYKSFLLYGQKSPDALAAQTAKALNITEVTNATSLGPIQAAIKRFLQVSESEPHGYDQYPLFGHLKSVPRELSPWERRQLLSKSMLAGVIRSGPILTKKGSSIFGIKRGGLASTFEREHIPFDKMVPLIESFNSLRDKTYYSLLAASGCRGHEARQIRIQDINVAERKVSLIPPNKHELEDLTAREHRCLSWKGRASENTFLIEPFKSMFFKYYLEYRKVERIATTGNSYLFQQKNGRPFFATSRPNRTQAFIKALKKIGLHKPEYAGHSLRHSYGFYTVNYMPLPNGTYGLPLPLVKVLMGHSSISSTEIYAKKDIHLIEAAIENANRLIFNGESTLTLKEIRIKYHQAEIDQLQRS